MSEKVDKFSVFSKKFAKLDNEDQDKLIKAAQKLLRTHRGMKETSISPLCDDGINAQIVANNFNNKTDKFC
jgi:hypothetical protein